MPPPLGGGARLATWTGGSYTYDFAGNVTRIERDGMPTLDLTWNSQYQLVSVSTNGVFAESYAYDALGRRVSTTTLEGTTRHVYDDSWQVIADLDENDNVLVSYTWGDGIDNLLAVKVGGATYYPLTDIQGTIWGYVDSQNNVVAHWQYDAWGNVIDEEIAPSASALASLRYRFQCREWSAATGLVNFRMRWYDAETGRWLSKDPIGLEGGINIYAFCENCPLLFVDPAGLSGMDGVGPTGVGAGVRPIISNGDKAYPGHSFNYHPDPFGHGRLPDGSPKQPHVDQLPKRGPGKVRFDLDGRPLKCEKGFIPKKDYKAYMEAVKDVLKAIGRGASAVGRRVVPILLYPAPLLNPKTTENGALVG